jgi:dual specificity phosphatase 12
MSAIAQKVLTNNAMYRTASRVDENVHIGGYLAAADPAYVRAQKYTHILKLFSDDPSCPRHPGILYMVIGAHDAPDYPLYSHFIECNRFIQTAIRAGGQVLVHGHAGVSRAATIVAIHLMINKGLPLMEAYCRLKSVRPVIRPNSGFWAHLVIVDRAIDRTPAEPGGSIHNADAKK